MRLDALADVSHRLLEPVQGEPLVVQGLQDLVQAGNLRGGSNVGVTYPGRHRRRIIDTRHRVANPFATAIAPEVEERVARAGVEPLAKAAAVRVIGVDVAPDPDQHLLTQVLRIRFLQTEIAPAPGKDQPAIQRDKLLPAEPLTKGA